MQFGKYGEERNVVTIREPNPYMSASYVSMSVWSDYVFDPDDDGSALKRHNVSRNPSLYFPEDTTANSR
jgi:hypothetical protein